MIDRIRIIIKVRHPNDFLKKILSNNINLYDISVRKKELIVIIDRNDLEKIEEIKSLKKIQIIGYYGINKINFRIKKYKRIILMFLIGILINISISNRILKIEIETSNQVLKNKIEQDLKELGISKLKRVKNNITNQRIKKTIQEKEKNLLEWIEIERIGTKYIIKLEEKKIKNPEPLCEARNIISKKNAIITKIEAQEGEIIKKKNDYVTKGEVIISGMIHNKEDVVSTKCSKGKVYGETWYKITVNVPKYMEKEINTNKKSTGLLLKFGKKGIIIGKKYRNSHNKMYNIIESKIIPIKIGWIKQQETKIEKYSYSQKEIEKIAFQKSEKILKNNLQESSRILGKKILKKQSNNSRIIVEVFYSVEEEISDYESIKEEDLQKE